MFKKYLEATTRAEKERMIKGGQKGLEPYRDHIQDVDKTKIPKEILERLPVWWLNANNNIAYVEDFIAHCAERILVNKSFDDDERFVALSDGDVYFTDSDSGILHYILVIYLILINKLPMTKEFLDWHKQTTFNVLENFICLETKIISKRPVTFWSGSYSSGSRTKVNSLVSNNKNYQEILAKVGIDYTKVQNNSFS
jgi:hypothetical protein